MHKKTAYSNKQQQKKITKTHILVHTKKFINNLITYKIKKSGKRKQKKQTNI